MGASVVIKLTICRNLQEAFETDPTLVTVADAVRVNEILFYSVPYRRVGTFLLAGGMYWRVTSCVWCTGSHRVWARLVGS